MSTDAPNWQQPENSPPIEDDIDLRKIFCGNISFQTEDEALYRLFRPCGDITEVCLIVNGLSHVTFARQAIIARTPSHRSKGFGFVTFRTKEGAQLALTNPNPRLDGRILLCKLAALGRLQSQQAKQQQQQQQIQQQMKQMPQGMPMQQQPMMGAYGPPSMLGQPLSVPDTPHPSNMTTPLPAIDAQFAAPTAAASSLWAPSPFDMLSSQSQSADAFFAGPPSTFAQRDPLTASFTPTSDNTLLSIWSASGNSSGGGADRSADVNMAWSTGEPQAPLRSQSEDVSAFFPRF